MPDFSHTHVNRENRLLFDNLLNSDDWITLPRNNTNHILRCKIVNKSVNFANCDQYCESVLPMNLSHYLQIFRGCQT